MKWLCKIGFHKYRFKEYYPDYLQFKARCSHEQDVTYWIEKCERCTKEKTCNDFIY